MRVYKLNAQGDELLHYDCDVIERGATWVHLRTTFEYGDVDMGFVSLNVGDTFDEWFYSDRWYNVFRVQDGDTGRLKGWYCNVTRPAEITANSVRADDLALDVFVAPGYTIHVLDEDEFAALDLSAAEQAAARRAVQQIKRAAAERAAPFDK
jgi:hypothetical protein